MTAVLLIIGFIFLLKGADFLIQGATDLAERIQISPVIIGLTIVAIGTSLPELIISVIANLEGNSDLILGNIFGSNLANTLLILGLSASFKPIIISWQIAWINIPVYVGISMILFAMMNNHIFTQGKFAQLTAAEGSILFLIFLGYMYFSYHEKKEETEKEAKQKRSLVQQLQHIRDNIRTLLNNAEQRALVTPVLKDVLLIIMGAAGLFMGGKLVVENAVTIALYLGMSESLIGLTIVSFGTTLPEMMTTIIAARKGSTDIAVGNIIGSVIINIVLILAITIITGKITISYENNIDFLIMFLTALMLWGFIFIGKKYTIERWQGVLFLIVYCSYITFRTLT